MDQGDVGAAARAGGIVFGGKLFAWGARFALALLLALLLTLVIAAIVVQVRVERLNRRTPSCASSCAICRLMRGCVLFCSRATAVKLPISTTRKYTRHSCNRSVFMSDEAYLQGQHGIYIWAQTWRRVLTSPRSG